MRNVWSCRCLLSSLYIFVFAPSYRSQRPSSLSPSIIPKAFFNIAPLHSLVYFVSLGSSTVPNAFFHNSLPILPKVIIHIASLHDLIFFVPPDSSGTPKTFFHMYLPIFSKASIPISPLLALSASFFQDLLRWLLHPKKTFFTNRGQHAVFHFHLLSKICIADLVNTVFIWFFACNNHSNQHLTQPTNLHSIGSKPVKSRKIYLTKFFIKESPELENKN